MPRCSIEHQQVAASVIRMPSNMLDYSGTPTSPQDRNSLVFSDQGAWFGYGFSSQQKMGFSGPFLMTQGLGEWSSEMLSQLKLVNDQTKEAIDGENFIVAQNSYNSHLEQLFENEDLRVLQLLYYPTPHTALIVTEITNLSSESKTLRPNWSGTVFSNGLQVGKNDSIVTLSTARSPARGVIRAYDEPVEYISTSDSSYYIELSRIELRPHESRTLNCTHTFIFPEYDLQKEQERLDSIVDAPLRYLQKRKAEKEHQLFLLYSELEQKWQDSTYKNLLSKTVLTLQNNTRIAAGEIKHAGIFPSYHYKWFLGFWAWDSWKHAAAVTQYDSELAKDQIRAMYDFQLENGFVLDCVFRDTSVEHHNDRNTKPPLSGWAVWKIFQQDNDAAFLSEIYPKIVKQHQWWYKFRDVDRDGICEYGSTDGTVKAGKWESGMDNAVRFDNCEVIRYDNTAFSLNQESVDLNAYLYAEKLYLAKIAKIINYDTEAKVFEAQAEQLKLQIQNQFFDDVNGWFYDTTIDGKVFIDVMGCEGWIPLWANAATDKQAEAVKDNMMDPEHFNTRVPFQTLSASHADFEPDGGYWRGPNWLDQAYFGVVGLRNYNYHEEANMATHKLIHNAEGVLVKGAAIRENYQPITGEGLESLNFSWSASHYLLLLLNE